MAVLPGQPGRLVPMMAPASDLPSLLLAVNSAAKILQVLAGPGPQPNNIYQQSAMVSSVAARNAAPTVSARANGATNGSVSTPRPGAALPIAMNNSDSVNGGAAVLVPSTWREEGRATRQLTIYHHDFQTSTDDKTQSVDVTRIDQLNFSPDTSSTEQAEIWRYGKPDPRQLPTVAQPDIVCGVAAVSGIFALGDWCCFQAYLEVPTADTSQSKCLALAAPMFTPGGTIYAGSYWKVGRAADGSGGKPTFLMGGQYDDTLGPIADGIIVASSDGQNWTRVYTLKHPDDPTEYMQIDAIIMALSWDPTVNQFWAAAHERNYYYSYYTPGDPSSGAQFIKSEFVQIILSSPDGYNWSEIKRDRYVTQGVGFDPNRTAPKVNPIQAHCSAKLQDHNGNNVPDGVYFYGTYGDNTIFIRPDGLVAMDYDSGNIDYSGCDATITITITDKDGKTTTKANVNPGLSMAVCVGFVDGVIMVGGNAPELGNGSDHAGFAISTDMGDTWKAGTYTPAFSPVVTIPAAHWNDIKGGQ